MTDLSIQAPVPGVDLLLGTDLVYMPRLKTAYARYGEPFFNKILTEAEWEYCRQQSGLLIQRAAGKIAVKEAVSKALQVGINGFGWHQGIHWKEVEIVAQPQSPPELRLTGRALGFSSERQIHAWRISLSHDGDYATATVIGIAQSVR